MRHVHASTDALPLPARFAAAASAVVAVVAVVAYGVLEKQ